VYIAPGGLLPAGGVPYEAAGVINPTSCQCVNDDARGCTAVPFTLGLFPNDPGGPLSVFEMAVDGYGTASCEKDAVAIETKARVGFVRDHTVALYMDLLSVCEGQLCPPGQTCDPRTRQCQDDTVPPQNLVPVTPGTLPALDLGPQPDFALADFSGVDRAVPPDLSLPPDLYGRDLAGADLTLPPPPDQSVPDLGMPPDLTVPPPDLSMSLPDSSFTPPDLTVPPPDQTTPPSDQSVTPPDQFGLPDSMLPPPDSSGGDACFVAGTPVWTGAGMRPIEQVAVGDAVPAFDATRGFADGAIPIGRVAARGVRRVPDVIELVVGGETLVASPDHPFFVLGRGFLAAGALRPGDPIATADGGASPVERALWRHGEFTVYNFEVGGLHSYFVGAGRLLVHNNLCIK
jgi:hypothetical protein